MGEVFAATDRRTGARVAVKLVQGPRVIITRFTREAAVLARIDHPCVVPYVAHGGERDTAWLAMKWLDGEDLAARLARGPLDLATTLTLVRGVAKGMSALHSRGVVHRDIKPSNIYLVDGRCDQIKLLDLGIAHLIADRARLTATGAAIGTPAYMSPEQARGDAVDPRADLYSTGCLLYECLTGETPFHAEHPIAILARMLLDDPPRLADAGVAAPAAIEALLAQLLQKDRALRPADGAALLAAMEGLDDRALESPARARPAVSTSELRILSVVIIRSDIDTTETIAPGQLEALEAGLMELAKRHQGCLECLGGSGFVAIFVGASDLGSRALQAAAFACDARSLVGDDTIALATGRAVVDGPLPAGPIIDRALSMCDGDSLDVRVDETSARLLRGRFELAGDGPTFMLRGALTREQPRRTVRGREIRFVGRRREALALTSSLESCVEESLATTILVVGDAGTGKSRLIREFLTTIRRHPDIATIYVGAGDVVGGGAAFGLIARALQSRAGVDIDTSVFDLVSARLAETQSRAEATRRAALLAGLVRGEADQDLDPAAREVREDPVLLGDAIADAWRALLAADCRHGAVIIVLEDIHWGDRASVTLIDGALRVLSDSPIFLLASARPEVAERFPRLWAARGVQELRLRALSERVASRLVRQMLGSSGDDELVAELVARGGGNPLFLEELVRALDLDAPFAVGIPDSVLALVHMRFDSASEPARRCLRAASIFGEAFSIPGLRPILGDEERLEEWIDELVEHEFIVARRRGTGEYAFVHALIRDAAYASLPDADRVAAHLEVGAWLAAQGETDALTLAEHFERGVDRERAGRWYLRAAEDALEGNDFAGALGLAAQARERGADENASARIVAEAHVWRGEIAEAAAAAEHAMAAAEAGSDGWYAAVSQAITTSGQRGRNDEVEALLTRALDRAPSPASDIVLICVARGLSQLMNLPASELAPYRRRLEDLALRSEPGALARGFIERVRAETSVLRWIVPGEHLLRARACFEQVGALRYAILIDGQHALARSFAGDAAAAVVQLERVRVNADALGSTLLVMLTRFELAIALFLDERDDDCLAQIEEIRAVVRGNPRLAVSLALLEGMIALSVGDYATAERSALFGIEAAIPPSLKVPAYGLLGRAYLRLGRAEEALDVAEKGLALNSPDVVEALAELAPIAAIEAAAALGNHTRARAIAENAWTWAMSLPLDDGERDRYLGRRIMRDLDALVRDIVPDLHGQHRAAPSR